VFTSLVLLFSGASVHGHFFALVVLFCGTEFVQFAISGLI
jgi:hypothetical protein